MNILIPTYGREKEIKDNLEVVSALKEFNILMPTILEYPNSLIQSLLSYKNFEVNSTYKHLFYYFFQDRFINEMSELEGYVSVDNSIEDIWRNFYRVVNFIEDIFDDFKPDIVYSGSPDNYFVNLFIKIAEIRDIKYFWLEQSYFQKDGFTFFSDICYSNDIFKSKEYSETENRESFFTKDIMKSNPTLFFKSNFKRKISDNIQYFKTVNRFKSFDATDLMLVPYISMPLYNIKNKIKRIKNRVCNKRILNQQSVTISDIQNLSRKNKLIMLALHYQPEAITLSAQPLFNNQYQLIKLISDILPPEYLLLVKEHPLQDVGLRNPFIYKQILSKKNVRLIKQDVSSNFLLENNYIEKVMSIGGTIGFEEMLRRNPSMVFSDIYYSNFKYTIKADLTTIDTFINSMQSFLEFSYEECKDDYEKELNRFLNVYYDGIIKNMKKSEAIQFVIENQKTLWSLHDKK